MKTKMVDTSLAAYHSLDSQQVSETKKKIMNALMVLGKASSEQIADYVGKDYDVIWKRCSDLKKDGKIFASDFKVLTRRKRFARQWMICDASLPRTDEQAKETSPTKKIVLPSLREKCFNQIELFAE